MDIILILIGMVIGLTIMFFCLRPKITITKEIEYNIEQQNKKIKEDNQAYLQERETLKNTVSFYQSKITELRNEQHNLEEFTEILQDRINKDNDKIYQNAYNLMQERLSQAAEQESEKYQEASDLAKKEYLTVLEESQEELAELLASKREELRLVEEKLDIMRAKAEAAIAAAKREEEKQLEIDKYKILVSEIDLLEINRLREIIPYFRNARAICKIIWESYYRNLTTEMINRVVGSGSHTGIYKLTNLTNQKIYIGQAVDISERFKQHIKCGLGIDAPNNMLYTAMQKDGVENFTFEVLEECERSQLNDREKYYIEFYHAQEFGYNMSKGGARN